MVLVTHNMRLARRADRVLQVQGGRLVATTIDSIGVVERSVG